MAARSTDWCVLAFLTVVFCATSVYVKLNLDHMIEAHRFPTSRLVMSPLALGVFLWEIARSISTALGERVPAALIFAMALSLAFCFVLCI